MEIISGGVGVPPGTVVLLPYEWWLEGGCTWDTQSEWVRNKCRLIIEQSRVRIEIHTSLSWNALLLRWIFAKSSVLLKWFGVFHRLRSFEYYHYCGKHKIFIIQLWCATSDEGFMKISITTSSSLSFISYFPWIPIIWNVVFHSFYYYARVGPPSLVHKKFHVKML